MTDVDIYSDPQAQLIEWGFSAYSTMEGFYHPEFISSFDHLPDLPEGWSDVGWILIGRAITDISAEYFANALFLTPTEENVPLALDGYLYNFITTTWFPSIDQDLESLSLAVRLAGPVESIGRAIAYGYDQLAEARSRLNKAMVQSLENSQSQGLPNLATVGYLPSFMLIDTGLLGELAYLYLVSKALYADAVASVESGAPVGYVDYFDQRVQAVSMVKKTSPLMIIALGFTAIGAVGIFGLTMAGKVKK